MNWNDITYWNKQSYGKAKRIKRSTLLTLLIIVCCITPMTNWIILFSKKIIKNDMVIRYD